MMTLTIPKMSCGGCVATIEKAIKALDANAAVKADLATKRVEIETPAAPGAVSAAVKAAGYENSIA